MEEPTSNEEELEDIQIDDGDVEFAEYSSKSDFKKAIMVETAMNKALDFRAKPMHPTYINTSISSDGTIKKEVIPDSRQAYVSAVIACKIVLTPELLRPDKADIKKKIDDLDKKRKTIFNECAYTDRGMFAKMEGSRWKIDKVGEPFIPENDQILGTDQIEPFRQGEIKGKVFRVKGIWNHQTNSYWTRMIELSDDMFAQLQILVDKLNYFKNSGKF